MNIFEVVREGDLESLKKLFSGGVDVETKDIYGETSLFYASKYGRFKIVKYLIEECNANVEAKDEFKYTPLSWASDCGRFKIVKYLIEKCNANVETKDIHGNTPLIMAFWWSHSEIVKFLIENGANYEELLEKLEKEGDYENRDQLEKIILEVADTRIKFITSDKY